MLAATTTKPTTKAMRLPWASHGFVTERIYRRNYRPETYKPCTNFIRLSLFDAAGVDEKKMILSRIIGKIIVNRNYDITIYFFLTLDDFKHALAEEGKSNVKVCEEPVRKRRFA